MLPQAAIRRAFQAFGVFPSQGDREEKKELGTAKPGYQKRGWGK
jgi:hypothetical protein